MLIELPAQALELSGPEAVAFAHAQFTSDLRALDAGTWQWSAWLSAQGRVRCWFALLRLADDRLLLWLRGADSAALRAELARFVFRSKVSLATPPLHIYGADAPHTTRIVGALPAGAQLVQHAGIAALRLPGGERHVLFAAQALPETDGDASDPTRWRLADIRAGLPELAATLQDRFLPQALGLQALGAVSVAKGCYPGQEIMARLHFKGGNKRGLYRVAFSAAALPEPGTELRRSDTAAEAGAIVMSATAGGGQAEALATLLDDAAAAPLCAVAAELSGEIQVVSRFG